VPSHISTLDTALELLTQTHTTHCIVQVHFLGPCDVSLHPLCSDVVRLHDTGGPHIHSVLGASGSGFL